MTVHKNWSETIIFDLKKDYRFLYFFRITNKKGNHKIKFFFQHKKILKIIQQS